MCRVCRGNVISRGSGNGLLFALVDACEAVFRLNCVYCCQSITAKLVALTSVEKISLDMCNRVWNQSGTAHIT